MKKISEGKVQRLQKLANSAGVFSALAIDQRGSLEELVKAVVPEGSYTVAQSIEFKALVSKELTPDVSAILLDKQLGLEAISEKDSDCGLILSYEKAGSEVFVTAGKIPEILLNESCYRMKAFGADALKVLVYYNPDDDPEVLDKKHAFLERLGNEAQAAEIPIFVEPLVYDNEVTDQSSLAFAKLKAGKVKATVKEFSKPQYQIDVLKIEFPYAYQYTEGFAEEAGNESVFRVADIKKELVTIGELAACPIIYLSAGVPTTVFQQELALLNESEAIYSGVLCGRATWQDGVAVYGAKGAEGLTEWLQTTGKQNVADVTALLETGASAWYDVYGGFDNIEIVENPFST